MPTLNLKHGFYCDGKLIKNPEYDTDKITGELYLQAANEANKSRGTSLVMSMVEMDSTFHLYLGAAAIIAANPEVAFLEIINNLKGHDIVAVSQIGRGFFSDAVDAGQNSSEELTEVTAESTTQA